MNQLGLYINEKEKVRFGQLKRKYRRVDMSGFICDIADGSSSYGGMVEDISAGGFKLTNLPESFLADKHVYTALVSSDKGKHYRLLATPCWCKKDKNLNQFEIGFRVVDAPWDWIEFTINTIQDSDYRDEYIFH